MENIKQNENLLVVVSQAVAVFVQDMIMLSIGMGMGYTTILVAGLSYNSSEDSISVNEEQLSWIGSIFFISCLLGCAMSGLTEVIGKKRVMQIVMVPFILSWILLYFSNRVWHIYGTLTVIGAGTGIIDASVLSYIAETTQPHLRGMLSATTTLTLVFGVFLEYLIGASLHWRTLALGTSIFPLIAFVFLWFIPETPNWLIARNRLYEARKSLAWLRGWTKPENIEKEFQELYNNYYSKLSGINNPVFEDAANVDAPNSNAEKLPKKKSINLRLFLKKNFLHPFAISSFMFFLINFTGALSLQTYGIQIITALRIPLNPYYAIVLMGVGNLLGGIVCIFGVRRLGKRVLGFLSMFGVGVSTISLGIYAFFYNVKYIDVNSYQEEIKDNGVEWVPLVFLILTTFSAYSGLTTLPWVLIGEIYTYETRAIATGISSAVYFITGFLANKIFFNMISTFYFFGVLWFYGCLSFLGLIINYFFLPETEGKTLQEISDHFAGFSKLDNKVRRVRQHE